MFQLVVYEYVYNAQLVYVHNFARSIVTDTKKAVQSRL